MDSSVGNKSPALLRWPAGPFRAFRNFGRAFFEARPRRHYLSIAAWVQFPADGLESWIEFHRQAGVEHFHLAFPHESAEFRAWLRDSSHEKVMTLHLGEAGESPHAALLRAARASRRLTRWLALIGTRDFLFSSSGDDLRRVLRDYEPYPGIAVFPDKYFVERSQDRIGKTWARTSRGRIAKRSASNCAIVNPILLRKIRADGTVLVKAGRALVDERGKPEIGNAGVTAKAEVLSLHRYLKKNISSTPPLFGTRSGQLGPGAMRGRGRTTDDRTLADLRRDVPPLSWPVRQGSGAGIRDSFARWGRAAAYAARETRLRMPRRRYLCMGMMFKDAAAYLVEWIEFHRLVGFEHFYLYDHASTDDSRSVLEPYLAAGLVTLRSWPAKESQIACVEDCIASCRSSTRWLALLDDDEFLFPAEGSSMAEALRGFEEFACVVVPWLMFGNSGHRTPPDGLVTENFTRRARAIHSLHKCIVDPARVERVHVVHRFDLEHGFISVNEKGGAEPTEKSVDPTADRFRLNHYYTKSYDEAKRKVRIRGYVPESSSDAVQQERYLRAAQDDAYNAVEDLTIQRFLPALRMAVANKAGANAYPFRTPPNRT